MVRTAITIISLLLSVLLSTQASGQNIQKIKVTEAQKTGDDYILYVKDIPLPDSVKIYGQPIFEKEGKYYGGSNDEFFKNNYQEINSIKGLTFNRDKDGIFFKIQAEADIDSVEITLVVAEYKGGQQGWCPKTESKYLPIVWRFRESNDLSTVGNPVNNPTDSIPNGNNGEETAMAAPSPWHISNIDWVLFALIILLVFVILSGNKQPQKKNGEKAEAAENAKFEIANLKKYIVELTTANNNCAKAINELSSRCNILENDIQKLKKKVQTEHHVHNGRENNKDTGRAGVVYPPMPPAQPINLGSAEPVAGEKALAINRTGAGFFQLTRNIDGQVTFTLIDNPEVRNLFETNSSMLGIYKNNGIISYDYIPNNSHVFVENMGIAKETGSGNFEVVAPLKLIFK